MMIKRSAIVFNAFAKLIVCIMLLWLAGCKPANFAQSGETVAEGSRRHTRNLRVNQESLSGDIDRAMLFDKPIQAVPLRIPAPVEPQSK
jgi:hypothetical protein